MGAKAASADCYQSTELLCVMATVPQCSSSRLVKQAEELLLPRVDGAGHGVVAVVHSVWSPAVAPHTLGAVVSGHSQVLTKTIHNRKDR